MIDHEYSFVSGWPCMGGAGRAMSSDASRSTDGVQPDDRNELDSDTRPLFANAPQSPSLGYDAQVDRPIAWDKETNETEDRECYLVCELQAMPDAESSAELVTGSESTQYSETSYISFTMDKLFSGKLLI